jgi:hypothetical protein
MPHFGGRVAVEQRNGIAMDRVQEIIDLVEHTGAAKTERVGGADARASGGTQ